MARKEWKELNLIEKVKEYHEELRMWTPRQLSECSRAELQ